MESGHVNMSKIGSLVLDFIVSYWRMRLDKAESFIFHLIRPPDMDDASVSTRPRRNVILGILHIILLVAKRSHLNKLATPHSANSHNDNEPAAAVP